MLSTFKGEVSVEKMKKADDGLDTAIDTAVDGLSNGPLQKKS